jgi:hypothetical protein
MPTQKPTWIAWLPLLACIACGPVQATSYLMDTETMMAAAGYQNELRVHLKGAVKNGCTAEQIQEVLLLLTLYCGIPAANEAHRIAAEVLSEAKGA